MEIKDQLTELLRKRERALEKINRAKEALGSGSWHEDSNYELADSEFRVWSSYLIDLEEDLRKLRDLLKEKKK